jgi:hypothetical protein
LRERIKVRGNNRNLQSIHIALSSSITAIPYSLLPLIVITAHSLCSV